MKCTLMHQRKAVVDLELDDASGFIRKIGNVHSSVCLPIGVQQRKSVPDRASLNEWWMERSIPMSRSGIREALETLGFTDSKALLLRCYGLSLSDQYWICPEGADITWDKINFFQNPFSKDVGDVLFGRKKKSNALDLSSPDNTSDGNLKKRWRIIHGKRYLVKGGSNPYRQQPFNEVIASKIMEMMNITHVPYTIIWDHEAPYSLCEDFVTADTDFVPAWRIFQTGKKQNNVSVYRHFVNCAEKLGIPEVVPFLDRMIVLDYLIVNEDRHFNNFGAVRDAETLAWRGMAPVYDSGSSLGYDKLAAAIRTGRDISCKPFKRTHEEQLQLVTDFTWINFDTLADVRKMIMDTFSVPGAERYMEESRVAAIADAVDLRIQALKGMVQSQSVVRKESTAGDVMENIAESYCPNS